MVTKGDSWSGGKDWGFGSGTCTLRYMEWLAYRNLYSTENSTQCSVIICVGKESEREWCPYMYNWITLLYSRNDHSLVHQLYFNKTLKNGKKKCIKRHPCFQNSTRSHPAPMGGALRCREGQDCRCPVYQGCLRDGTEAGRTCQPRGYSELWRDGKPYTDILWWPSFGFWEIVKPERKAVLWKGGSHYD